MKTKHFPALKRVGAAVLSAATLAGMAVIPVSAQTLVLTRDSVRDHFIGITGSFNNWDPNGKGEIEMTDPDGDGIYTASIEVERVTADMLSEFAPDGKSTGEIKFQFKVRLDGSWDNSWGEYEYLYDRTMNSQTNCSVYATEGYPLKVDVSFDTTKACDDALYASEEQIDPQDEYIYWGISYTVDYSYNPEHYYKDFRYTDSEYSDTVYVDKYRGNAKNLKVPAKINGKKVSYDWWSIGALKNVETLTFEEGITEFPWISFSGWTKLKKVSIPSTITEVDTYTLGGIKNLSSITVAAKNKNYSASGGILYNKKKTKLIYVPKQISGAVKLPSSVKEIEWGAFQDCKKLTSVTLPNNIKELNNVFSGCTKLKSVKLPSKLTTIGWDAFYGCKALTSVSIPSTVESIGYAAFQNCTSLKSISFPAKLVYISGSAFEGCTKLKSVTIPSKVTYIGSRAFYNCKNLSKITLKTTKLDMDEDVFAKTKWYISQKKGNVYVGKVYYGYKGTMSKKTTVKIKKGTVAVAGKALCGQKKLTGISLPDSVTTIGYSSFANCTAIKSVTIPKKLKSLGAGAFSGCTSLSKVTFKTAKATKLSVGCSAFLNCKKLKSVKIPEGVTYVDNYSGLGKTFNSKTGKTSEIKGFKITGKKNSEADRYAGYNGLTFIDEKTKKKSVYPTGLKLNKTQASLKAGKTLTLKATVSGKSGANKNVTWYSWNWDDISSQCIKVDKKGKVTAKRAGTAVVYAYDFTGKYYASCEITVKK